MPHAERPPSSVAAQAPLVATRAPASCARHALLYVTPSQVHTGLTSGGHDTGRVWQVPSTTQAKLLGNVMPPQNCVREQSAPVRHRPAGTSARAASTSPASAGATQQVVHVVG